MSARVGVMGGGQLARMLAVAGVPMGLRLSTFDPAADACAAQLVPQHRARFDDTEALRRFAAEVDVVTFDFENVPAASAEALAASVPVYPSPRALAVAQDRLAEKTLFGELGIPVAGFANIDSLDGLEPLVWRATCARLERSNFTTRRRAMASSRLMTASAMSSCISRPFRLPACRGFRTGRR